MQQKLDYIHANPVKHGYFIASMQWGNNLVVSLPTAIAKAVHFMYLAINLNLSTGAGVKPNRIR